MAEAGALKHDIPQAAEDSAERKAYLEMEERSVQAEAQNLGMDYVAIADMAINPDVIDSAGVTRAEMEKAFCLPFYLKGLNQFRVAVAHPDSAETKAFLDAMRARGAKIHSYLAAEDALIARIANLYSSGLITEEETTVADDFYAESSGATSDEVLAQLKEIEQMLSTEKPEKALHIIMVGGTKGGASDVHLEAYEGGAKLRFRIDGILHDVSEFSLKSFSSVVDTIKYSAHLKMNVKDVPQDGRFAYEAEGRKVDVRVSTLPTSYGESVVMRLLDTGKALLSVADLGFEGKSREWLEEALLEPTGMMLTTGPTGSGKTSTLYAILNELNDEDVKIITLEDPVEYYMNGVVQSQIAHEKGYDFSGGLRAILRQDPDVVMVGEIRDLETAEIASQAALTGHKVLSTLHTNSAVGVISRFINMGLERFMIGPSLKLVIAQRLVRRTCKECCKPIALSSEEQKDFASEIAACKKLLPEGGAEAFVEAVGCEKCGGTGYKGRVGIYEVFKVDATLQDMVVQGASEKEIYEYVRNQGMMTLREDGVMKAMRGETTLAEVLRTTGDSGEEVEEEVVQQGAVASVSEGIAEGAAQTVLAMEDEGGTTVMSN